MFKGSILLFFILIFSTTAFANGNERFYQSASVLVMDSETGIVLYETEGFTRRYPASITKVMTALLVLEQVSDMNDRVFFSAHAVDIPWYASRMGILEGESVSVLEAMYGIMLPSGNEVARALAEHVSGSVPAFVEEMNRRARELGAYSTRFVNPCGLPGDGQFITAYDVALIMKEAIRHPLFLEIIGTAYFEIEPTEIHGEPRRIRNSNRMVRPLEMEYNEDIIGGKTGFTNAAQHTLVSYARRDGRGLIISVLYAPSGATFTDTQALADFIFSGVEEEMEEEVPEYEPEEIEELPPALPLPLPEVEYTHETTTMYAISNISDLEAILATLGSLGIVGASIGLSLWLSKKRT